MGKMQRQLRRIQFQMEKIQKFGNTLQLKKKMIKKLSVNYVINYTQEEEVINLLFQLQI